MRQALNPIGSINTTINKDEFEVLDISKYGASYNSKYRKVSYLYFKNIGDSDLIFKVNNGEKMILQPNRAFKCGDIEVFSLKIYTQGAKLEWTALMNEPYKE